MLQKMLLNFFISATSNKSMTKNLARNATLVEISEMIADGLLQKLNSEALKT